MHPFPLIFHWPKRVAWPCPSLRGREMQSFHVLRMGGELEVLVALLMSTTPVILTYFLNISKTLHLMFTILVNR